MKTKIGLALTLVLGLALLSACKKETASDNEKLYERGKLTYVSRCAVCHNQNPHEPGSVGPDVWGSSRELIEARVLHAEYPPGYKPKRDTHLMVALPDVGGDIDAIYAYLNDKR